MSDNGGEAEVTFTTSTGPVRVITAASLFDGHDAAINVMRRLIQSSGAEVIHLGHDRSAQDVVDCAIQEDAHAVALTSYQEGTSNTSPTFDNCSMKQDVNTSVFLAVAEEPLRPPKLKHSMKREFPKSIHLTMVEPWA